MAVQAEDCGHQVQARFLHKLEACRAVNPSQGKANQLVSERNKWIIYICLIIRSLSGCMYACFGGLDTRLECHLNIHLSCTSVTIITRHPAGPELACNHPHAVVPKTCNICKDSRLRTFACLYHVSPFRCTRELFRLYPGASCMLSVVLLADRQHRVTPSSPKSCIACESWLVSPDMLIADLISHAKPVATLVMLLHWRNERTT